MKKYRLTYLTSSKYKKEQIKVKNKSVTAFYWIIEVKPYCSISKAVVISKIMSWYPTLVVYKARIIKTFKKNKLLLLCNTSKQNI